MKKLLSILLAVVLLVSVCPFGLFTFSASAATSGTTGDCTWTLDGTVLTISGNGSMGNYINSYQGGAWRTTAPWGWNITQVIIEDGVTSIGEYAFRGCSSLTSVTIGNSVTSIGVGAFRDCSSLTSITIPDSVTSIGGSAFYKCSSLTSITIPDGVTSIGGYAFEECSSLASITIPNSVTRIGDDAFYNTAYYNNSANWENDVLYIGKHLIDANETISGAYTIKQGTLTIAGYAFYGCTSLTSINIPNSVTRIGIYAFDGCSSFTSVTIPDSVTSIGDCAFSSCSSLKSITIPDSVTSIGNYAFSVCSSLTSITIPDSVTSIGYDAFYNTAYYNNSANWENDVLYIGKHLIDAKETISGAYTIKQGTLTIAGSVFYGCTSLTSITIPDSVTSMGNYAFYNCDSLKNVYFRGTAEEKANITIGRDNDNLNNATWYYNSCIGKQEHLYDNACDPTCNECNAVRTVSHVYDNNCDATCNECGAVRIVTGTTGDCTWTLNGTVLTISGNGAMDDYEGISYSNGTHRTTAPWGDTLITEVVIAEGVTNIGKNAFYGCDSLISVTFGNKVTNVGDYAFYQCVSLTSITIPDSVINIGVGAFEYCGLLSHVSIGNGVTKISDYAFYWCVSLTSITIPDSVTSIGDSVFYNCNSLKSVNFGKGITYIGKSAFYSCGSLTSATIPSGVTDISENLFSDCNALISITIPNSVTSVGTNAFYNCYNLKVYYTGSESDRNNITVGLGNIFFLNTTWHYKPDKIDSFTIDFNDEKLTLMISGCDKNVTEVVVPETVSIYGINYTVTAIGSNAFYGCKKLESVTLPDTVTAIGSFAFTYCTALKEINFGIALRTISMSAFYGCTSLEEINLPEYVSGIGSYAFTKCSSLNNVVIGSRLSNIPVSAFYGCNSLKTLVLSENIRSIGYYAFYGCDALTDVYYDNVSAAKKYIAINNSNVSVLNANWHYTDTEDITYIFNDRTLTATVVNCSKNAVSVTIPDSIVKDGKNYKVTAINAFAFNKCSSLTSVVIGDEITTLNMSTFYGCKNLKSVTFGANMKTVGYFAFYGCDSITDVYFNGTEAQKAKIAINSSNSKLKNATWHYNA